LKLPGPQSGAKPGGELQIDDAPLQLCGDEHPGFSRLDKRQQHLVFFRLPGVTGLAGHYAFFALSWRSPISAIYFELEAAGTSAVKRHG
jgi:hypothetical protein